MGVSAENFIRELAASGLMSETDVRSFVAEAFPDGNVADGEALARGLVRRKKLTAHQAQQIYAGNGKSLVLGNYVVLDKLGQGGMGMVLKAEHRRMKRVVALKVLSPAVTKTPDLVARFQREVHAAARLEHPNIVAAYDADDAGGTHFLVMHYVAGSDLATLVKNKGPLPIDQAVHCILQAARGLEYAHQRGVIHRDIKPANLLLDADGTVKILDMGLARIEGETGAQAELTNTGAVMGTVDYMAPEQALSTKSADARSDIYSLGITLWYLLVGRPAYEGDSLMARLLAHREQAIPSLKASRGDVPESLDHVFRNMVAKRAAERYQSMTEVIAALEACLRGEAPVAPSVSLGTSEGNKLEEFLRNLQEEEAVSSRATQVASGMSAVPGTAGSEFDATMTSSDPGAQTDPHTLTKVADVTGGRSRKRAATVWWNDRRVQIGGSLGAVCLLLGVWLLGSRVSNEVTDGTTGAVARDGETASKRGKTTPAPPVAKVPFDAAQAKRHQDAWARHLGVPVEYTNSLGMKFRLIPPGEFLIGSTPVEVAEALQLFKPDDERNRRFVSSAAAQRRMVLTQPYFLGVHEVTQRQYRAIMGANPSAHAASGELAAKVAGTDTANHPVEGVRWTDAAQFCNKLGAAVQLELVYVFGDDRVTVTDRNGCRLPTEAEWEFACRAGTTTRYWTGDDDNRMNAAGWTEANSTTVTHEVGKLTPNLFGLYDVHGNVWEWCHNLWEATYERPFSEQPMSTPLGGHDWPRALRGGDCSNPPIFARSSFRFAHPPSGQAGYSGFRVLMPVEAVSQASRPNQSVEAKHRLALEWVLKSGGKLVVNVGGQERRIERLTDLPSGLFELRRIDLTTARGIKADDLKRLADVSSEFFLDPPLEFVEVDTARVLAGIRGINVLALNNVNPEFTAAIGDALGNCPLTYLILNRRTLAAGSIAALSRLPNLEALLLWDCTVPESVLAETAELPRLRDLNLQGSGTTDQNLAALSLPNLAKLSLFDTPVTAEGLAAFHRRHPKCTFAGHDAIAARFQSILAQTNSESALEFDGIDDYVELPLFKFDHDKPLTIEAWFTAEPEDIAGKREHEMVVESVFSAANGPEGRIFSLLLDRPNAAWWAGLGDPQRLHSIYYWFTRVDRRTDLYGTWHHAAVVWDGSGLSMYVDGRRRESGRPVTENAALPKGTPSKLDKYHIGAAVRDDGETLSRFFYGRLDELRFSQAARYTSDFTPPAQFETAQDTLALYHFDEGSGDVLKDSSGNNHHGKIVGAKWVRQNGAPTSLSAISEYALSFDGISNAVEIPTLERNERAPATLEAWVRNVSNDTAIVARVNGKAPMQLHVVQRTPHGAERDGAEKLQRDLSAAQPIASSEWTHLAYVLNDGEARLYVNGKLVSQQPGSYATAASTAAFPGTWIGGRRNYLLVGEVDEVRFSRSARYRDDFEPARRFEPDAETLALYHCDEGAGDLLKDSSGNNHHGKIVGAKWVTMESSRPPSQPSYALDFSGRTPDGNTSHVVRELPLRNDQPFTVELLVTARTAIVPDSRGLFDMYPGFTLKQSRSKIMWMYDDEKGNDEIRTGPLEPGRRINLTAVAAEQELRLFVDGRLAGQAPLRPRAGKQTLFLLGRLTQTATWSPFDGTIEEARISRGARYEKDFTPAAHFEPDADTLALYHFDEGAGNVLKDSSGNNHHGQIVGAKWVKVESLSAKPVAAIERNLIDDERVSQLIKAVPGTARHPEGIVIDATPQDRRVVGYEDGRWKGIAEATLHVEIEALERPEGNQNFGVGFRYGPRGSVQAKVVQTAEKTRHWEIRDTVDYSQPGAWKTLASAPALGESRRYVIDLHMRNGTVTLFVNGRQMLQASGLTHELQGVNLSVLNSKWLVRKWTYSEAPPIPQPPQAVP